MTFRSHDGLIEMTDFADAYHWLIYRNHLRPCPACGYQMRMRMYPTFNMAKYGKAIFTCPNEQCTFNENPIKIEATGGYPNGLESLRLGKHPGDN